MFRWSCRVWLLAGACRAKLTEITKLGGFASRCSECVVASIEKTEKAMVGVPRDVATSTCWKAATRLDSMA